MPVEAELEALNFAQMFCYNNLRASSDGTLKYIPQLELFAEKKRNKGARRKRTILLRA